MRVIYYYELNLSVLFCHLMHVFFLLMANKHLKHAIVLARAFRHFPSQVVGRRDATPSPTSRLLAATAMTLISCCLVLFVMSQSCRSDGLETSWDTACKWGGLVISKGGVELADGNCDSVYPKEDWQPPQPLIKYPGAEEDKLYTVFVLNPDPAEHPDGTFYLHMLQANIKGSDLKNGDFSQAFNIATYIGPPLAEAEGVHRYMFVVYKHEPGFEIEKMDIPKNIRWNFNLQNWLNQYGQKLTGPVAGVQFKTEHS